MIRLWAFLKCRIAELIRTLDPPRGRHRGPKPGEPAIGDDSSHRSAP